MGEQLTDEELKACKNAFALFDRDGDGTIACKKAFALFDRDGDGTIACKKAFALFDRDGDGTIACKKAFALFDRDGDGTIGTYELETVMRSLGYSPTEAEILDLLNEFDPDGLGTLDFPTYLSLMAKKLKEWEGEESLRLAFNVFDKENNGTVTVSDFRYMMDNLKVHVEEKEIEEMIKEADKHHTGFIAYNEFITMISAKQ